MDPTAISALAALFGSLIGGLTTLATAWASQRYNTRSQRLRDAIGKREALYSEYIDEASKRMIDALEHDISDGSQVVRLYGLYCRIQLLSSGPVVDAAEKVMKTTAEVYIHPSMSLKDLLRSATETTSKQDPIVEFSRICRAELDGLQRRL